MRNAGAHRQEATGIRKHPEHVCGQASEDQMVAFLAAAGDLVSYVREDEHLQLSAGTFASPEDLSAKALGATLSQGAVPLLSQISVLHCNVARL